MIARKEKFQEERSGKRKSFFFNRVTPEFLMIQPVKIFFAFQPISQQHPTFKGTELAESDLFHH
jgi:hypothetical protein